MNINNINLTLLVQAGNFFLGYLLITRFFLKPTLEVIYKENKEQEDLEVSVALETNSLNLKKAHKQHLWRECQRICNDHKPSLQSQMSIDIPNFEREYALSKSLPLKREELEKIIDEIAQTLKLKVINND